MVRLATALLALLAPFGIAHAQDVISRYAWRTTTQGFSAYGLRNGQGVGSADYLATGQGPGSLHYFVTGQGFGSAYFLTNGSARGSLSFWRTGTGSGSRHHWLTGTGCLSRHFWLTGSDQQPAELPCSANADHALFVMTMCLAGQLDIEPCDAIMTEVRRIDPDGSRYLRRIEALRAARG